MRLGEKLTLENTHGHRSKGLHNLDVSVKTWRETCRGWGSRKRAHYTLIDPRRQEVFSGRFL